MRFYCILRYSEDFFGTWDQSCTFYGNVSQGGLTGYLYSTDTFTFKSPNIFSIQISMYRNAGIIFGAPLINLNYVLYI